MLDDTTAKSSRVLPAEDRYGLVGLGQVPPGENPQQRALSRSILPNQQAPSASRERYGQREERVSGPRIACAHRSSRTVGVTPLLPLPGAGLQ